MEGPLYPEAMTAVCMCGAKALYRVGAVGYCKAHRAEAMARQSGYMRQNDRERWAVNEWRRKRQDDEDLRQRGLNGCARNA